MCRLQWIKTLKFVNVKWQVYDTAQLFNPCYEREQCFHYEDAESTFKNLSDYFSKYRIQISSSTQTQC